MVGFDSSAKQFFIYFCNILLSHYITTCFAMLSVSISRNFAQAALVGNLWFTVQSMASGYFVQTSNIPVYVRWLKYLCYIVGSSWSHSRFNADWGCSGMALMR